jgi:DNA-directed RNA polymerase specialized sigma24 family protein
VPEEEVYPFSSSQKGGPCGKGAEMSAECGTATQRDMAPTPAQLASIRRTIRLTAARFNQWLSSDCVQDLVQEVLLRLWKCGMEEKLNTRPGYVHRVAANVAIDELRRRGAKKRDVRRTVRLDVEVLRLPSPPTPEEILIEREEVEDW